jgi:hypothetical protein
MGGMLKNTLIHRQYGLESLAELRHQSNHPYLRHSRQKPNG